MIRSARGLVFCAALVACLSGCQFLPEVRQQPVVRNPFPQLTKVAVAPFFNLSTEPTTDGRQFALAYFNELQLVQGYEVVPVGVVEQAMQAYNLSLDSPTDARRLAQVLGVDAVVVGAVTDFAPDYPPRCGLQVEWYAANPCFHPIPPGYGLPFGTSEQELIPEPLIFETELAQARAALKWQTPPAPIEPPLPLPDAEAAPQDGEPDPKQASEVMPAAAVADVAGPQRPYDPQGPPPSCLPSDEPVLRHTRTFNGHDGEFTAALQDYFDFRADARIGGWEGYLQRSDDFIRFCCYLHISQMLTARGGAAETRVVWRWPSDR